MQLEVLAAVVAVATVSVAGMAGQDLGLFGGPVEQLLLLQSQLQLYDAGVQLLEALHPLLQPRLPHIAVEGEAEGAQAQHVAGHVQQGYEPDCGARSLLAAAAVAAVVADVAVVVAVVNGMLTGGRGQATSYCCCGGIRCIVAQ